MFYPAWCGVCYDDWLALGSSKRILATTAGILNPHLPGCQPLNQSCPPASTHLPSVAGKEAIAEELSGGEGGGSSRAALSSWALSALSLPVRWCWRRTPPASGSPSNLPLFPRKQGREEGSQLKVDPFFPRQA